MTTCPSEAAGVTVSDSDSAHIPKFLKPDACPEIFQISSSDSCSDSGYQSILPKFAYVFSEEMTKQAPATAEIEK